MYHLKVFENLPEVPTKPNTSLSKRAYGKMIVDHAKHDLGFIIVKPKIQCTVICASDLCT